MSMKSKKRITVFVSLLLVIALALTGCGGNNTNEASNPQNASGDTGKLHYRKI